MGKIRTARWLLWVTTLAAVNAGMAQKPKKVLQLGDPQATIYAIEYYHGGTELAVAEGSTVKFYQLSTQRPVRELSGGPSDIILDMDISPDATLLASGGRDGLILLWDIERETLVQKLELHTGPITSVTFSPDGRYLASGSTDHQVVLFDLTSEQVVHTFHGHTDHVTAIAFSANGQILASASADRTVRLWDPTTGELISTIDGLAGWPRSIAFSPDSTRLVFCGDNARVSYWDVQDPENIKKIRSAKLGFNWLLSVDLDESGMASATGGMDGKIRIDHRFGQYISALRKPITQVALSPKEKTLEVAAATLGGGVLVIDGRDMKLKSKQ